MGPLQHAHEREHLDMPVIQFPTTAARTAFTAPRC
jgi:hypothetical protein